MDNTSGIPAKYTKMVGKSVSMSGGVFSAKKNLPAKEYQVLDIRWGSAVIVNFKQLKKTGESKYENPTYELLVKSADMKKSQWTRGFPIREINLKKEVANG